MLRILEGEQDCEESEQRVVKAFREEKLSRHRRGRWKDKEEERSGSWYVASAYEKTF